jgi:predicted ATPase
MYISRIKLFNWKNFHDCEVALSERCFIVGANATGKSNFLDVIRFMRDIVKQGGGLQAAVACIIVIYTHKVGCRECA